MALRCLLFTSETGTAEPIRQALSALGIEGEHCLDAATAIDKATHQSFQIVIIDWDQQPEAAMVLAATRERKASERPLSLAIVNEEVDVPKALQAGANSILRRPILINQVKDTLTTARDLLKAKESAAAQTAAAAANPASNAAPSPIPRDAQTKSLRAGEFLPTSAPRPSGEFVVEGAGVPEFTEPAPDIIDPLTDLEPMAASVAQVRPAITPPPQPPVLSLPPVAPLAPGDEARGLDWYMKRAGLGPSAAAPAPAPISIPTAPPKPELLGFDQTPSSPASAKSNIEEPSSTSGPPSEHEKKAEERLFAYIEGESSESETAPKPGIRISKRAIVAASVLAACAIVAAPQAPWHASVSAVWARGQHGLHAWLNPQPVTTPQAPETHESFGRAGDEYKLPVAETIPDATTDPSQIRVVPVIDPTAKKPNSATATPDQSVQPTDSAGQVTDSATLGTATQGQTDQPVGSASDSPQPVLSPTSSVPNFSASQPGLTPPGVSPTTASASSATVPPNPASSQPHSNPATVPSSLLSPRPADPAGPTVQVPQAGPNATVAGPAHIPSSLKSQIASMTPDASGNKPPEAALPSIEPVMVSEATERQLATDRPVIGYPANAKGQQGTVVLQVLIGRDGTVQDAKFLQGSFAFARAAIDGVRQWKFKPYTMNGRPVSVQTNLTMNFKSAN